jgi:hypothetical protein
VVSYSITVHVFFNIINSKPQRSIKSQISSIKSQINHKFQAPNLKQTRLPLQGTSGQVSNSKFQTGSTRSAGAHAAQAPALRVRRVSNYFFVWDLGHWLLLFICFLGFVIWNFH